MALVILWLAVTALVALAACVRPAARQWDLAARIGAAALFAATGISHFTPYRHELAAMVPEGFGDPNLLIAITGVLELLGAAGLLLRRTAWWAAAGLVLLLIAIFPANVADLLGKGDPAGLVERTLRQVAFALPLVLTLGVRRPGEVVSVWRRPRTRTASVPLTAAE